MPDLPKLLLQIAVILLMARIVGWLFQKIHQPQVIGEMIAGLLLGPSLLGWVAPKASAFLFPPESLGFLSSLSEIGLLLFMFLVGVELNPKILKGRSHTAVVVSHVSILAPFFLGSALALYLYPRLSDDSVSFVSFALFIGTAMSITAFPVLARILAERKLLNTHLGIVAIACAAIDDVTGWTIFAVVVFIIRSTESISTIWLMLLGIIGFVALMLFVIRPVLKRLESLYFKRGDVSHNMLAVMMLVMLASSWVTETLGIHALFGAFLAGAIMPKSENFIEALTVKINDAVIVLFLPLFFAFTGLRTSIGLLNGTQMWFFFGLILLVAVLGKFGGSSLAARVSGMNWRESGALGVLMNTRGLIELVLLNIGLDLGVISPTLFAMFVLMALITTFMTSPLLEWIYFARLLPGKYAPIEQVPDKLEKELVSHAMSGIDSGKIEIGS